MRIVPSAWAFGVIEQMRTDGRVQVGMPHGRRTLSQVFEKDQIIIEPVTTYDRFHTRLELKRIRREVLP